MKQKNDSLEYQISQIVQEAFEMAIKNQTILKPPEVEIVNQKPNNFLNIKEASEFTRLAKQSIYQLVSKRKIPFIKKGSRVIFERNVLEVWMKKSEKLTKIN